MEYSTLKTNLDFALYYRSLNWPIFPVRVVPSDTLGKMDKKPMVSWAKYQNELPSIEQIKEWWTKYPEAGIGLATGKLSGFFVLDVDLGGNPDYFGKLKTLSVRTGSGGYHFYFNHPGQKVKNSAKEIGIGLDIRGDGGFVVLPPTKYGDKSAYEWLEAPTGVFTVADAPLLLLSQVIEKEWQPVEIDDFSQGAKEGERNNREARYVGLLLANTEPERWEAECWPKVREWNNRNQPPLKEKELRMTFESIRRLELNRRNLKLEEIKEEELKTLTIISHDELYDKDLPPLQWIIEGLIPEGCITVISAAPESYKSFLMLYTAVQGAKGGQFLDTLPMMKFGTLYLDEENGDRTMQQRIHAISEKGLPIYYMCYGNIKLNKETVALIIGKMKELNLKLVIFDSFVRFLDPSIHDENSAASMADVGLLLKQFNKEGLTVVFLHHHRKSNGMPSQDAGDNMRGSSDLRANVDCHIILEKKENFIIVKQEKLRVSSRKMPTFKIEVKEDILTEKTTFSYSSIGDDELLGMDKQAQRLVYEFIEEAKECDFESIEAHFSETIKERKLRAVIREIEKQGIVSHKVGHRRKYVYFPSNLPSDGMF